MEISAEMDEEYSPTAEAHMNDAWDPEEPNADAAHASSSEPAAPPGAPVSDHHQLEAIE